MAANIKDSSVILLVSFAVCLTTANSISAPADIEQEEVFKMGEGGNYCFRIPALVFTVNGTLLAFAEGRGRQTKTCSDHGPDVHIVLKRSTDFGDTWSSLSTVYAEPGHTIGNPTPVIDQATGKVILAFCRDNKEVFTIESTDNGLTWGSVVNISSVATEPEWGFVGTGPPGGIQLPSGRLVIASYAAGGGPGSYSLYSDDGSKTWHRSQPVGEGSTGECQAAALGQTSSPLLILAMRSPAGRYIAYSKDGGETWFNVTLAKSLAPQTPCEGSIVAIPYKGVYMDTHLYLTSPHSTSRLNMTVFTSSDGGHSWGEAFVLWKGPSAYSSLAYHSGRLKLYCLYERGNVTYTETLTLAVFSPLILHH